MIFLTVLIPDDVYEGQTLMVRSPDGQQVIPACVPKGYGPGETFVVQFPTKLSQPSSTTQEYHPEPGCVNVLDNLLTPNPSYPEVTAMPIEKQEPRDEARSPVGYDDNNSIRDSPETTLIDLYSNHHQGGDEEFSDPPKAYADQDPAAMNLVDVCDVDDDDDEDRSRSYDHHHRPPSPAATAPPSLSNSFGAIKLLPPMAKNVSGPHTSPDIIEEVEQKVLLVRVPSGMPVGSIIHVEIPGENRTVAATVPDNVSFFHVCYTPRPQPLLYPRSKEQQLATRGVRQIAPRPEDAPPQQQSQPHQPRTAAAQSNANNVISGVPPQRPEQKLLLVRVPPNTTPGSTVHVSVPDEPGRILAAIVPPGNVREFHISYVSRTMPVVAGLSPNPSFVASTSALRLTRNGGVVTSMSRRQEPPAVRGGRHEYDFEGQYGTPPL